VGKGGEGRGERKGRCREGKGTGAPPT